MNLGTEEIPVRVVLDTNIIISAILCGGKPDKVLNLVLEEKITAIISPVLTSELKEVFSKKFPLSEADCKLAFKNIEESFEVVQPEKKIDVLRDKDDNRVLEAAIEGDCAYIITGDKDLLELRSYKKIKIITASDFLSLLESN